MELGLIERMYLGQDPLPYQPVLWCAGMPRGWVSAAPRPQAGGAVKPLM